MNTNIVIISTKDPNEFVVSYFDHGRPMRKSLTDIQVNSLLNMRQKEKFFIGQESFKVDSEYDFKRTFEIE